MSATDSTAIDPGTYCLYLECRGYVLNSTGVWDHPRFPTIAIDDDILRSKSQWDFFRFINAADRVIRGEANGIVLSDGDPNYIVHPCAGSSNDRGLRYNTGKAKWSLIDFPSLEPMVRVMEYGANKYAPHNWKKGMSHTEISECLMRHLFAYLNGEDIDPESGQSHIGHIQANAMFLQYNVKNHPQLDDRFKGNSAVGAAGNGERK